MIIIFQSFIIVLSGVCHIGLCATCAKLYPTMKPYEYGFRVFLLTYCIEMVSGCSSSIFFQTASFYSISAYCSWGLCLCGYKYMYLPYLGW